MADSGSFQSCGTIRSTGVGIRVGVSPRMVDSGSFQSCGTIRSTAGGVRGVFSAGVGVGVAAEDAARACAGVRVAGRKPVRFDWIVLHGSNEARNRVWREAWGLAHRVAVAARPEI